MSHDESSHSCACGGSCGCNSSQESSQVYLTRDEYIGKLEQYLVDLRSEIASVEQELMELKTPAELVEA